MKSSAYSLPILVLILHLNAPTYVAAITCTEVISDLRPCLTYLQTGSGKPPTACCAGASALAEASTTSADRRAACECIKTATKTLKPNPETASANLDCTKLLG